MQITRLHDKVFLCALLLFGVDLGARAEETRLYPLLELIDGSPIIADLNIHSGEGTACGSKYKGVINQGLKGIKKGEFINLGMHNEYTIIETHFLVFIADVFENDDESTRYLSDRGESCSKSEYRKQIWPEKISVLRVISIPSIRLNRYPASDDIVFVPKSIVIPEGLVNKELNDHMRSTMRIPNHHTVYLHELLEVIRTRIDTKK